MRCSSWVCITSGLRLGSIAASAVVDRIERRLLLCLCAAALTLAGATFVLSDSPLWLGASAVAIGVCGVLYIAAINLYATELFQTQARAGSAALAWSFNRIGAASSIFALVPLLKAEGHLTMFGVIAASLLLLASSPRGLERQRVT